MNVPPAEQLRLLDLQAYDAALHRITSRRAALPEHAQVAAADARIGELSAAIVDAETAVTDLDRAIRKLETEVDLVRTRSERDAGRLASGAITVPRQLEELQSEIASLQRRQSALEDDLLELMEQREAAGNRRDGLAATLAEVREQRGAALERLTEGEAALDREAALARSSRDLLAPQLPAELVAHYEKVRATRGGVGAAALVRRRCEGCHLELSGSDLTMVRTAAVDAVLHCEECGRILVRTAESGLG